jgi:hypothetical protein
MTKPAIWRPLHEFNLCRLLRPEPLSLCHDFFCDCVLMLAFALWQIRKRHLVRFKVPQSFEYLWPIELVREGWAPSLAALEQ